MTDKTDEQIAAEAAAFVDHVRDTLPRQMDAESVMRLAGLAIVAFSTNREDAVATTMRILMRINQFFAALESGDAEDVECDCPRCRAERKVH